MNLNTRVNNLRGWLKRVAGMTLYVVVAALIGYLLLVLVYSIPVSWMQDNMTQSVTLIKRETDWDHAYYMADNQNDITTDCYMLLAASHEDNESPWQAAADVVLDQYSTGFPQETLFQEFLDGGEADSEFSYARYWHGYLVLLKPLLCLFDYGQIRYLMAAGQVVLLFAALSYMQQRLGRRYALALVAAYLWLNPITTMSCMQFNVIATLSLLFVTILLARADNWLAHEDRAMLLFCTYGLLTSYFDFLTYPVVSLGLPLLTYVALRLRAGHDKHLRSLTLTSVSWAFGYFGMWALKWVYGSFALGRELFSEALYNAQRRSSGNVDGMENGITYINLLKVNVVYISVIAFLVVAVILLVLLFYGKGTRRFADWRKGWPIVAVSIYPLLWYAAFQNHSYVHGWFTFRDLAVGVYGVMLFAAFIKEHN